MSVFNEELLPKLVRLKSFNALHDFADKLHMFTVMLYFILMVVMFSQYALTPIQCYIPVSPSGARFSDFLNAFCWTHGTIPIRPDEPLPSTMEQWMEYDKVRRIGESSILVTFFLS